MEANELQCALEAVLFAAGEPVAVDKLCQVLEVPEQALHEAAQALAGEYDYGRRGIKLVRLEDRYQLCSRADYAPWVRRTLETRRAPTLSAAALEVLAIAAYRQPVTRVYIEQVRAIPFALCAKRGCWRNAGSWMCPAGPPFFAPPVIFSVPLAFPPSPNCRRSRGWRTSGWSS